MEANYNITIVQQKRGLLRVISIRRDRALVKLLAKPNDFYDVEIDIFGSGVNDPTYTITVSDESEDGLPPLCDRINELIEGGFRFTKFELNGDSIGWKYFKMEMRLRKDLLGPNNREARYNWQQDGTDKEKKKS